MLPLPDKSVGFQLLGASFDGNGEHWSVRLGEWVARGAGKRLVCFWVNHIDG
jgi:hypothetical protein